MKKIREYNTDIYVEEQGTSKISLLQSPSRIPLSKFISNEGEVRAITNCSYFTTTYVLGRNQGDLYNDAPDQDFYSVVIRKDGSYACGKFMSNVERDNIVAGFSPAIVLIQNGKDVELVSKALGSAASSRLTTKNPNTAFGIKKDGKAILIVNEGRSSNDSGLTGRELRTAIKKYYDLDLLVLLDGGGSTELIVDKKIINTLSDGSQRSMFNGIAFIGGKGVEEVMADIIKPVKRDENKDQLEVITLSLRVRETPTTNGKVLGHAELNGIYNNLEQKQTNTYTWYRINTDQWVADKDGEWVKLLPKKDNSAEEIKLLKERVEVLVKEVDTLKDKISKALDCLG